MNNSTNYNTSLTLRDTSIPSNVIAVSTVDITLPCEVMAVSTVDIPIPSEVMAVSTVDIPIPPSLLAVSTVDSNIPLEEMTTATGSGSIPNVLPITTPSQQSIPPKTSIINTRATIIQQHQKPLTVPINRHKAQDKDIPSSLISPKDPNPTTMTPNNSKNSVLAVPTVDSTLPI